MVRRSVFALGSPLLFVLPLLLFQPSSAKSQFDTDRAGFSVRFRNDVNPHTVLGLFVVPGERIPFEVLAGPETAEGAEAPAPTYEVEVAGGKVTYSGPQRWVWQAPEEKGLYPVHVTERPSGRKMLFNALVMVRNPPHRQVLNGYRLGSYPLQPLRGIPAYLPPKGFIEVSAEYRNVPVAPHFTLGQFLCKQGGGELQYMALRERLLLKLEAVLEEVNTSGYRADTLFLMSGFRTPSYNRSIGQGQYSRHIYGDAADIFIDQDRDGRMDDLNRDGLSNLADATLLYEVVQGMDRKPEYQEMVGGLGLYNTTKVRGPFVHVDTRGFEARWFY
jgi:hypothetical protein